MAYSLKAGRSWQDQFGNALTTGYGITDGEERQKKAKSFNFWLYLYKDRNALVNGFQSIKSYHFAVSNSDYDTYFSPTVLASTALPTAIQNYLLATGLATYTNIVVNDWQVDANPEP